MSILGHNYEYSTKDSLSRIGNLLLSAENSPRGTCVSPVGAGSIFLDKEIPHVLRIEMHKRTRRGGPGGGSSPNFGEIFKNQPHSGNFLPLVGLKCWPTMGFVLGSPPRFFLPVRLCGDGSLICRFQPLVFVDSFYVLSLYHPYLTVPQVWIHSRYIKFSMHACGYY